MAIPFASLRPRILQGNHLRKPRLWQRYKGKSGRGVQLLIDLAADEEEVAEDQGLTVDTRQAKDFLVQQRAEQAVLESVPFSDLEKRMMYFTESDPASCPDPLELNDEFEKQYETDEYEAKVSQLLQHAYKRLKHEDPEALRNWNEAVHTLRKGDHYILILL